MNSEEIPIYESNIFSDLPNVHSLFRKELYPFLHPKPLNYISVLGINNDSVYNLKIWNHILLDLLNTKQNKK